MSVCSAILLSSCLGEEKSEYISYEIVGPTEIIVGEFDISDYKLILTRNTGEKIEVSPDADSIGLDDLEKLSIAGSHTISISYDGRIYPLTVNVSKAVYDMSGISFEDKVYEYDGEPHGIEINGVLPEGVSVIYDGNGQTDAGEYTVTAKFVGDTQKHELIDEMSATLKIEKREIKVAVSGQTELIYNGSEQKTLKATALNVIDGDQVELFVEYSGEMIYPGVYTATVIMKENGNYILKGENTVTVTIAERTFDIVFRQDGEKDLVFKVVEGGKLDISSVDEPKQINGYHVEWEDADLTCIDSDMVVNTVKIPLIYDIVYFVSNGDNSTENPVAYTIESEDIVLRAPEKEGYDFAGWYTNENCDGNTLIKVIKSGSTGNLSLYAKWIRKEGIIRFDGNGATDGEMEEIRLYVGETRDLPRNAFGRKGYTFGYWTDEDGMLRIDDGGEYTMTDERNVVLYAVWSPVINTLIFDGNGATGGKTEAMQIKTDETVILNTNGFEREYYAFAGWSSVPDGEAEWLDNADYRMGAESEYVIYAVWEPITYNIIYVLNGGTNAPENPSSFTVEDLPLTLRSASPEIKFAGWFSDPGFSEKTDEIAICGNMTLYAKFSEHTDGISFTLSKDGSSYSVSGYSGSSEDVFFSSYYQGKPVTEIADGAFENSAHIRTADIPVGVKEIGDNAFRGCASLERLTIPRTLNRIGNYAFYGCEKLSEVCIDDMAAWCGTDFGNPSSNPLYYATGLYLEGKPVITLDLTDEVMQINDYAFYGYSAMTALYVGNNVGSIGAYAFGDCTGLKTVVFSGGLSEIKDYAFYNCVGLTCVDTPDIASWCEIVFGKNYANPLYYSKNLYIKGKQVIDLIIPERVTEIKAHAFNYCIGLNSVTFGKTVESIGQNAFGYCDGLTSVYISDIKSWCAISFENGFSNPLYYAQKLFIEGQLLSELSIPDGVNIVGNYAFVNCTSLLNVRISDGTTEISASAFYGCKELVSVTIPSSVSKIGSYAFYNCTSLTDVYFDGNLSQWQSLSINSGNTRLTQAEIHCL